MRDEIKLDDATIEAIAMRVAAVLERSRDARRDELMTAAEVATWWGVERSWVYEHARELGVIRLGEGPSPRLRFDRSRLQAYLDRKSATDERVDAPPRAFRSQSSRPERVPLLQSRPRRTVPRGR